MAQRFRNKLRSPPPPVGLVGGDIVPPATRSKMMKAVRQRDTKPEIWVRRVLHRAGIRYRTSNRDLPGAPDIANRRNRWAVFVNGCFWHGHKNCSKTRSRRTARVPVSNRDYWSEKLQNNRKRDSLKIRALRKLGYTVILVWECQIKSPDEAEERLVARLSGKTALA